MHVLKLYLLHHYNYLLSYYPDSWWNNSNSSKWKNSDIFFWKPNGQNTQNSYEKDIELIRKELFTNKNILKNYIELWSENINTEKLYNWYKEEVNNLPKYNTFINNCSDEVDKALKHAWFFTYTEFYWIPTPVPWNIWLPWTTPVWLRYDVQLELFYKNLFN